ncbi:MAG: hypothetical protein V7641_3048 [Blastocatellia bacterium]
MKRNGVAWILAMFAVLSCIAMLLCIAVPAQNQNRIAGQERGNGRSLHLSASSRNLKREFVPRVIGRANSSIINGHIVALRGQQLSIETASGERLNFQMDEQTTLLESNELVSIATLDDITLRPADLRLADEVEVVAERVGNRRLARIVTRTASGPPLARR